MAPSKLSTLLGEKQVIILLILFQSTDTAMKYYCNTTFFCKLVKSNTGTTTTRAMAMTGCLDLHTTQYLLLQGTVAMSPLYRMYSSLRITTEQWARNQLLDVQFNNRYSDVLICSSLISTQPYLNIIGRWFGKGLAKPPFASTTTTAGTASSAAFPIP